MLPSTHINLLTIMLLTQQSPCVPYTHHADVCHHQVAGMVSAGFTQLGTDQEGLNYRVTSIMFLIGMIPIFFVFLGLPNVYIDRPSFYRETASGLYTKHAYAITYQLAMVPYLIAVSASSCACILLLMRHLDVDATLTSYHALICV